MNSLLFLNEFKDRPRLVSDGFFTDVGINKFLDRATYEYISVETAYEEAYARQCIFKLMLESELRNTFLSIRKELAELDALFSAFDASKNTLESVFRSRLVCNQYIKVCGLFDKIDVDNALLTVLPRFSATLKHVLSEIQKYIDNTEALFSKLKSILLKRTGKMAKANEKQNGIIDNLLLLAAALDIETENISIKLGYEKLDNYAADTICKLNSEMVGELSVTAERYINMLDREILHFRRDVDFYLKIYDIMRYARDNGLDIAIPEFTDKKIFIAEAASNIAMLKGDKPYVVPNDIFFDNDENFFFVCGANGSGKTSYLKTVAINVFMGILGCPMFCKSARLYKFNKIYTLFSVDDGSGNESRFVREKNSVNDMLNDINGNDIVLLNEMFSSTFTEKAVSEISRVVGRIMEKDACGLFVTHFGEMLDLNVPVLVVQADTHKITRKSGQVHSSVRAILEKYGLSEADLIKRFAEVR